MRSKVVSRMQQVMGIGFWTICLTFLGACSLVGKGAEVPSAKLGSASLREEDIAVQDSYEDSALDQSDARARLGDKAQRKGSSAKPGKKTAKNSRTKKSLENAREQQNADSTEVAAIIPGDSVNWDPSRGEIPEGVIVQESGMEDLPRRYKPVNYPYGPLRTNPSLWPDESQSSSLFRDFRAFQPMDIITIIINENSEGKKKADTDTKTDTSVLAGIARFFGIETSKWESNNLGLDPTKLIDASTQTSFKGEGETNRSGKMTGQISARIVEVLPNGLLKVEGRKSLTLNEEEEVIVIKGLVRPNDVSALNQVQSNRIANLEISFYGKGVLGNEQSPGWLYGWFRKFWPF